MQIVLDNFNSIVHCQVQRNLGSCSRKLHSV